MAKLLMGSIVTKAVGRINGHCFRIQGSTQILQRNPLRGFQNAINTNKALSKIRNVMASWLSLGSSAWEGWRIIANDNPVTDRFGNPKTLTARAFYTKCAINCSIAGLSTPDYVFWKKDIPECTFDDITLDVTGDNIDLLNFVNVADTKATFRIMPLDNESMNPNPLKVTIGCFFDSSAFNKNDLYHDLVVTNGYNLTIGKLYYCAITVVSSSGVVSVTRAFKAIAV